MEYRLLDAKLLDRIEQSNRQAQSNWLFLAPSEEFRGRWSVDSLWPEWFLDFEDLVGHYRTVSPANLDEFLSYAKAGGYQVAWVEPPEAVLRDYEHLGDLPPFSLSSSLENTTNGLLPWQIEGFNKLIKDESLPCGLAIWDTGTGKTAFIASALLWHLDYGHEFDIALVVVKKNNKADTQRKLQQLAHVPSLIIEGTPTKRQQLYREVEHALRRPNITGQIVTRDPSVVLITNYEKFREDREQFIRLVKGRRVLFFWDEMPTRLSNRKTEVYKAVRDCLWAHHGYRKGQLLAESNPSWMRQFELSATPIENSPEGFFNCLRLMDPGLLGSVTQFYSDFCAWKNPISHKPEKWRHLDKLEGKIEHLTHRVSRADPQVASMFPEVMEDQILIDWDPRDRTVYDTLSGQAIKEVEKENAFEEVNILALIQILQMVCDAPSMIIKSAENRLAFLRMCEEDDAWEGLNLARGSEVAVTLLEVLKKRPTDAHHTKFEVLREILTEKHPEEKALVYMTWASYGFEPMQRKLDEWGISHVVYTGTEKQRQHAKDAFREDPSIRVFLSSDKGSDSIDLPEAAVGINYNLPWTWTRKRQRQGRNNRVDSSLGVNFWYDLLMSNSIELRKCEILNNKRGFHEALFDKAAVDDSISSKLSRADLLYILSG